MIRAAVLSCLCTSFAAAADPAARPNVLLAIADDQSYPHCSAYGAAVRTPAFDRIARAGVLFRNGFAGSPGCSPSRAALLTGRHHWQLEAAGTHASSFPAKFATYPDLLEAAGYSVGMTGKGWGPGDWKAGGRERNPAGPTFDRAKAKSAAGVAANDYAANFAAFLDTKPADRPFCFWFGAGEPHRPYDSGIGERHGIDPAKIDVPPFLPDTPEVRSDLADYFFEIEHFDRHLGRMLDLLEARGELANTLVIVTADNGMPFPRAKANLHEYGWHVPLAVAWPARVPGGRVVDDLAGFVDLAPTILEAAGLPPHRAMSGRSLTPTLVSERQGLVDATRTEAFGGRERHSSSRHDNLGYPSRAIRTPELLLIRNFRSERWPAGDPHETGKTEFAFADIDAGPTKSLLIERWDDPAVRPLYDLAVAKRSEVELYDVRRDPGCLTNLADGPGHAEVRTRLERRLDEVLRETGDPRVLDGGEVWETYPRFSPIRSFPRPE